MRNLNAGEDSVDLLLGDFAVSVNIKLTHECLLLLVRDQDVDLDEALAKLLEGNDSVSITVEFADQVL